MSCSFTCGPHNPKKKNFFEVVGLKHSEWFRSWIGVPQKCIKLGIRIKLCLCPSRISPNPYGSKIWKLIHFFFFGGWGVGVGLVLSYLREYSMVWIIRKWDLVVSVFFLCFSKFVRSKTWDFTSGSLACIWEHWTIGSWITDPQKCRKPNQVRVFTAFSHFSQNLQGFR